ncbi:hypothetical protein BJX70DRAFT_373177 [Aspergillus crustosus]
MSSFCSNGAQETSCSKCIAKLASFLKQTLSVDTAIKKRLSPPNHSCLVDDPPLYAFSTYLLNALMAETSSPLANQGELISFVDQHHDLIVRSLETVSLQCLSSYLIRAAEVDGLHQGLRLLLACNSKHPACHLTHFAQDDSDYSPNPGLMSAQTADSESTTVLPLVRTRLLERACSVFTDTTTHAKARRMAGKVLADIVHKSEQLCPLLLQLNDNNCVRTIIESLTSSDSVISFFASSILRALYLSGDIDAEDWGSGGSQTKLWSYIDPYEDPVQQFYLYARSERQHLSSIPGKTRDGTHSAFTTCFLVHWSETHESENLQGLGLLILSTRRLDLLSCSQDKSSPRFDYFTVQLARCTRTRCSLSGSGKNKKLSLTLHIDEEDTVTKNEQSQKVEAIYLSITSGKDLTDIRKGLEAIGIPCRIQRHRSSLINRRASSLVIPLVTADDTCSSPSTEGPSGDTLAPVTNHVRWRNESKNSVRQLDYPLDIGTGPVSPSSLTELTRTPTVPGTSPQYRQESPDISSPDPHREGQQGEAQEEDPIEPDPRSKPATDPSPKHTQSRDEAPDQNERDTTQSGPARNTRSRSSLTENRVLRPIPPNTQESLIFPRRRSRAKLYTAPSKTMVDWDEDLRASDASAELTSIPSPLPNGTSYAFTKSPKLHRKGPAQKKKATKQPTAIIKKQTRKEKKMKGKRLGNRQVKLVSSSPPKPFKNNSQTSRSTVEISHQEKLNIEPNQQENVTESIERPHDLTGSTRTPKDVGKIGRQIASSASPKLISTEGRLTLKTDNEQDTPENSRGRGQSVGQKLIAAFRGSITPKHHLDRATERQPHAKSHGTAAIVEDTEPKIELFEDYSRGDQEADHIADSWAQDMSQEVSISGETYSVISPRTSQASRIQDNAQSQDWILEGTEVVVSHEGKDEVSKTQEMSSPVTSQSVESPSTESIFEYFMTRSQNQPEENSLTFYEHSEKGALPNGVTGLPGAPTPGIAAGNDDGAAYLSTGNRLENHNENKDSDIKLSDSGSKIIVDRNGSPRLMRLARSERVTLKRRAASPSSGQGAKGKQSKRLLQADICEENPCSIGDVQNRDDDDRLSNAVAFSSGVMFEPIIEPFEDYMKREHPDIFQKTLEEFEQDNLSSNTAAIGKEKQLSFLDRLIAKGKQPVSKALQTVSSEISTTEPEQEPVDENKENGLTSQGSPAGELLIGGSVSGRNMGLQLSKSAAGQLDWQTSLQKLHKDMQSALLDNNKRLARQIESERTTVKKVLDGYKEQCNGVLDQLYEAQLQRIRLCKQQMVSIKQQHTNVRQELISRLEEDGRSLGAAFDSQ